MIGARNGGRAQDWASHATAAWVFPVKQAASGKEIIAFTPTLKVGLIANGVAPAVLRLAMSVNGYMLNKKRGRAPVGLLFRRS